MGINRNSRMAHITDGSSNTIIVAEQSARVNLGGRERNLTNNYYGGWSGYAGRQATDRVGRPHWGAGTTCIRYKINHGNGRNKPVGGIPGADNTWDFNTIVNSYHTGGIHVGIADGSVRFLSENINFTTFNRLGSMNDGDVVGEF